jgi:hypothetical protein
MTDLIPLERAVLKKVLEGEDNILSMLRQQLEKAKVTERKVTGVGFYTTLAVPDSVGQVPGGLTVKLGDVHADIADLRNGAGFLLYVQNGRLDLLEGYTYDEPWPQEITGFELSYDRGEARDLDELGTLLHGSDYSAWRRSKGGDN